MGTANVISALLAYLTVSLRQEPFFSQPIMKLCGRKSIKWCSDTKDGAASTKKCFRNKTYMKMSRGKENKKKCVEKKLENRLKTALPDFRKLCERLCQWWRHEPEISYRSKFFPLFNLNLFCVNISLRRHSFQSPDDQINISYLLDHRDDLATSSKEKFLNHQGEILKILLTIRSYTFILRTLFFFLPFYLNSIVCASDKSSFCFMWSQTYFLCIVCFYYAALHLTSPFLQKKRVRTRNISDETWQWIHKY